MKRYKSEVAIERSIKCVVKEVKVYDSNWEVFLFGKKNPRVLLLKSWTLFFSLHKTEYLSDNSFSILCD